MKNCVLNLKARPEDPRKNFETELAHQGPARDNFEFKSARPEEILLRTFGRKQIETYLIQNMFSQNVYLSGDLRY